MRTLVKTSVAILSIALCGSVWAQATTRTASVSGTAEVLAEPDRAQVTLGIEARKPQLEAARTEVARGIDAILKLTRELKIDAKDVRTTRLTVQPEYDWNSSTRERRFVGYYVARQAEVVVRDLEQLGLLLERAVTLGANNVGEPRLESSRRREFERQALELAIKDARLNAEAAARAANATLGAVRNIDSTMTYTPLPMALGNVMTARAMSGDTERAATYQAGQLTFSASVRVLYDLEVK